MKRIIITTDADETAEQVLQIIEAALVDGEIEGQFNVATSD